jgi:hypothetical protein
VARNCSRSFFCFNRGSETVNTYLQGRKITAAHNYERPSVKFFISSANFGGLEWRKKRSGLKRNYMKPPWLAVSSRPRTKPTRSHGSEVSFRSSAICVLAI